MFGLLSFLGNKHLGWGTGATSSLFPASVWAEHIPEPKRSHVSKHTWAATLTSMQRKLLAGISLGSPFPSLQQPLDTSQFMREAAWLIKLGEASHSLSKAYRPILWVCIQISERQSPSPVLDSEKPPHYSFSLMNSEYSRDSWKHSASGSEVYRLWRGLRQGKMGEHMATPHVPDTGHTSASSHGSWQPSPSESILSQSGLLRKWMLQVYTTGLAILDPKNPFGFRNYLVHRIFNILFQNCLQQSEGGGWEQRT